MAEVSYLDASVQQPLVASIVNPGRQAATDDQAVTFRLNQAYCYGAALPLAASAGNECRMTCNLPYTLKILARNRETRDFRYLWA